MKTKRILAFILTILMIGGMFPTVFAEDTDVVYNPAYDFSLDVLTNYTDRTVTTVTLATDFAAGKVTIDSEKSAPWSVVRQTGIDYGVSDSDGLVFFTWDTGAIGKSALVLKVNVDKAGTYVPTIDYKRFPYSGKVSMYAVPASYADENLPMATFTDVNAIISDSKVSCIMDHLDMNGSAAWDTHTAPATHFEAGENYIILSVDLSDTISSEKYEYADAEGGYRYRYYGEIGKMTLACKGTIDVTGKMGTMKPGESTQLSVSVTDGDGVAVPDAEITYDSTNKDAVTVSSTGLVEAVGRGTSTVTVSAKVGDVTVYNSFTVTSELVWNPKYVFTHYAFADASKVGSNFFSATDITNINPDVSSPWAVVANINMTNKHIDTGTTLFCVRPADFDSNAVVLKIVTEAAGIYQPTLKYTKTVETGKVDIYFISASDVEASGLSFSDATSTNALIARSKLGISVDQSKNSPDANPFAGEGIYLPAGESYMIIRTSKGVDETQNGSGYYYCYMNELSLTHVEGISTKISNANLGIGKSATLSATALDADGNALPGAITFESSAPSVAKVEGNVVTGLDEGKATITAKVEGTSYSDTVEVNVSAVWDPNFAFKNTAVATLKDGTPVTGSASINLAKAGALKETVSSGSWKYVNVRHIATEGLYGEGLQFSAQEINFGHNAVIFDIELQKPGTFNTSLSYVKAGYCGRLEAYVVPKSYADKKWTMTSDALNVAQILADPGVTCIASVDAHTNSADTSPATATGVKLDEKNAYLIFTVKNTDAGTITDDKTRLWGYPSELAFTRTGSVSATSADTTLEIGETTTVSAATYDNRDNAATATVTFESLTPAIATVSGNTVTALTTGNAKIRATATIDGVTVTDTVTINVTPKQISVATQIGDNYSVKQWDMGEEVEVTASALTGKVFRHWVLGTEENGIPVSESATYTFKALTNTYLTAVYSDAVADDAKVVEFYLENGGFVGSAVANEEGKVELPDVPSITGYVFSAWMTDSKTAFTADTIVEDLLTKVVGTFNAETITDTEYSYGDKIENKSDTAKIWKRNDKVVAYGTEYTYYVWADFEIISEDGVRPETPIIVLDNNGKRGGARMIEYDANGFEIVEAGILFGDGYNMTVDSCQYKAKSNRNLSHGQFTAKPPVEEGYTTARGYVVYVDANGEYQVVYSH